MGRILLTEGFVFGASEIIPDNRLTEADQKVIKKYGNGSQGTYIQGKCQMANTKNGNGRIYPMEILKREIDRYAESIRRKTSLGELDHPDDSVINLKNVSHMITDMWWEGNDVMCKCLVLDTPDIPSGRLAAGLMRFGVLFGISSRGLGSVREDYKNGGTMVEDDFNLICFDLVSEPSTPGAWQYPMQGGEASQRRNRPATDFTKRLTPMEEQELLQYLQRESKNRIEQTLDDILRG